MSKNANTSLPCPACGFHTLEDAYGSYEMCETCGWEDDGVQLANPCSHGGANALSLAEYQDKALKKYPLSVVIAGRVPRSHAWRPLTADEKKVFNAQAKTEHWQNKAVLLEVEAYWCANS